MAGSAGTAGAAGTAGMAGAGGAPATTTLSCSFIGDFDGDGIKDCARSQGGSPTTRSDLWFNKGVSNRLYLAATVVTPAVLAPGYTTADVFDVNHDSRQDLVVATPNPYNSPSTPSMLEVGLINGNADGTFTEWMPPGGYPTNPLLYGLGPFFGVGITGGDPAAGDFDGDGYPDFLKVSYRGSIYLSFHWIVARSSGGSDFHVSDSAAIESGIRGGLSIVATVDINKDGKLDIVAYAQVLVAASGSSYAGYSLGKGNGSFAAVVKVPGTDGATQVSTTDANGDGKLDLLVTFSPGSPTTFYGDAMGNFSTTPPP